MQCMDGVVADYLVQNKDPFLLRAHVFAYIMIGDSNADKLKTERKAKPFLLFAYTWKINESWK